MERGIQDKLLTTFNDSFNFNEPENLKTIVTEKYNISLNSDDDKLPIVLNRLKHFLEFFSKLSFESVTRRSYYTLLFDDCYTNEAIKFIFKSDLELLESIWDIFIQDADTYKNIFEKEYDFKSKKLVTPPYC